MTQEIAKSPQLVGLMLYTDGRRLDQLLGGADYETVTRALSKAGVPPEAAGTSVRGWSP